MQIVRVYSGNDGESHFEDLSRDQFQQAIPESGTGPITLHRLSSPSVNDFHPGPPNPQYLVFLAGEPMPAFIVFTEIWVAPTPSHSFSIKTGTIEHDPSLDGEGLVTGAGLLYLQCCGGPQA